MKKAMRLNNQGLSLLTAVIAVVVLSIALLSIGQIFLTSIRNNGTAGAVTELTNAAQFVQERVMVMDPVLPKGTVKFDRTDTTSLKTFCKIDDAEWLSSSACPLDAAKHEVTLTIDDARDATGAVIPNLIRVTVVADYSFGYANTLGVKRGESFIRMISFRPNVANFVH